MTLGSAFLSFVVTFEESVFCRRIKNPALQANLVEQSFIPNVHLSPIATRK
jgi:hypothetical protein